MIRLIQRRLIVPRGDTGVFSIPILAGKDSGDASIFTIFNPLTHRKIFEKVMDNTDGILKMDLTHGDTVNLPVGNYVWDIKFYTNPIIVDEKLVSGTEVDSYYSAFQLPVCEIRETGDNLLMADDAPDSKLAPDQINYIDAAIIDIHESRDAAVNSAAEANVSATNAETSASAAAVSEAAAQDSQEAALASQQAAQAAASDAANSAAIASQKAAEIAVDLATKADKSEIPTLVSQLQNDAGYLSQETDPTVPAWAKAQTKPTYTAQEVGALPDNTFIPSKVSDLTNDAGYLTEHQDISGKANAADLAAVATSGAYSDLSGTPTNVSAFTNDAGYLTQHQDISGKANSADLAAVATSGSYNDLSNKPFIPSAVSDLTDDSGHYTKPANGIPATDMTSSVQTSLGLADTAYQKPNNGIPASDLASGVIPSVPVQDVQIKNTSILNNGVANIPLAANGAVGLVQGNNTYGTAITAAGDIMIYRADDSAIKNGNGEYKPIVPYTEHQAVFYGLAKAAGDTTQRESQNNVGIYTSSAQSAIQAMLDVPSTSSVASSIASAVGNVHSFDVEVVQSLPTQNIKEHTIYFVPKTGDTNDVYDEYIYINNAWEMVGNTQIDLSNYATKSEIPSVPVQDIQINQISIVSNGVANIQKASSSNLGVVGIELQSGVVIASNGKLEINPASTADIKKGEHTNKPIVPFKQDVATFYGLATAAGDTTQSTSSNAVGTYTTEAKAAIRSMLGAAASADLTVQDIQINGTSILNNGTANIPVAGTNVHGVVTVRNDGASGILLLGNDVISIYAADIGIIKLGNNVYRPITPVVQHQSVFYGLAKAAGDTTQSQSDNAVGTYTTEAKTAILNMFGLQLATDAEIQNIINGGAGA